MSTRLFKTAMLCATTAMVMAAGLAQAAQYQSVTSGDWSNPSSWQIKVGNDWVNLDETDFDVPAGADTVAIIGADIITVDASAAVLTLTVDASAELVIDASLTLNGSATIDGLLTVDAALALSGATPSLTATNGGQVFFDATGELDFGSAGTVSVNNGGQVGFYSGSEVFITGVVATFTVASGGNLDVDNGASVFLSGSAPGLIFGGMVDFDGYLQLDSSSGAPYVRILTTQSFPLANGVIAGLASAALQPQLRIDSNTAANTLTNLGRIGGDMAIKSVSPATYAADFVNHGEVTANAASCEIKLDASLNSIADNAGTHRWEVNGTSAKLTFDIGSTGLAGDIRVFGAGSGGQQLNINAAVITTGQGQYEFGTVTVAGGQLLRVSSRFTGTYGGNATHTASLWTGGSSPYTVSPGVYAPNP